MKKIHSLMLKSFALPMLASFSVTLFILVMQFLAKYQNEIFGKGFGSLVIGKLFFYTAIQLSVLAMPIGVLMAALMTLGKIGENYELAAMKSAGISLFKIIRPLIVFCVVLAGISFYFTSYLIPAVNLKLFSLLYDVQQAKPELALKPGLFEGKIPGMMMYYAHRSPTGRLLDLKIWDHTEARGNVKLIEADSATVFTDKKTMYLRLTLYYGKQYYLKPPDKTIGFEEITFDSLHYKMDISGLGLKRTNETWFKSHQYMMNLQELYAALDSVLALPAQITQALSAYVQQRVPYEQRLSQAVPVPQYTPVIAQPDLLTPEQQRKVYGSALLAAREIKQFTEFSAGQMKDRENDIRKFRIELHLKFALPLGCIILLFIGASLGAIIRKGGLGVPAVAALGFFVLFYILMSQGRKLAREEVIEVWFGMWLPTLVLTPLAIFLTYQAATDSKLMDLYSWKFLFRKIGRKLGLIREPKYD